VQAFEDYYALGPGRSLSKLTEQYQQTEETQGKVGVPTTDLSTLAEWSAEHNWQARIKQRIAEEAEKVQEAMRERHIKALESGELIIDTSLARTLNLLQAQKDKTTIATIQDLATALKLRGQIAGEPLVDRTELTTPQGKPIQAEVKTDGDGDRATPTEIAGAILGVLAESGVLKAGTDSPDDATGN